MKTMSFDEDDQHDDTLWHKELGVRLSTKRNERKLSARQLTDMTEPPMCHKHLYTIENGKKKLKAVTLYKLAMALGVSADWLMGIKEHPELCESCTKKSI